MHQYYLYKKILVLKGLSISTQAIQNYSEDATCTLPSAVGNITSSAAECSDMNLVPY